MGFMIHLLELRGLSRRYKLRGTSIMINKSMSDKFIKDIISYMVEMYSIVSYTAKRLMNIQINS